MDVKGHAALVTGGASGLGRATAEALIAAGAKVAILDKNAEALAATAAEIGALAVACDVTQAGSTEDAVAAAREAHGPARVLMNCAGVGPAKRIVGRDGPMPLEWFEAVIAVNLIGTFNALRLAAADMMAMDPLDGDERGIIINTSSVAATEGQVGQAAYTASKGGVAAMTLPAAREFARHGIRVNTIAPGLFGTPMLFNLPQEVQDALGKSVPFPNRIGRPDEYAALAMHLIDNAMINGEVVRLDGALRMAAG